MRETKSEDPVKAPRELLLVELTLLGVVGVFEELPEAEDVELRLSLGLPTGDEFIISPSDPASIGQVLQEGNYQ